MADARRQKKMMRKLEGLRAARLSLAELKLAGARRALEQAQATLADEQARLERTEARSHEEYRELTDALMARTQLQRETLYEWQMDRRKVAERVDQARADVAAAERAQAQCEHALAEARAGQRGAMLDVERTRLMQEKMP